MFQKQKNILAVSTYTLRIFSIKYIICREQTYHGIECTYCIECTKTVVAGDSEYFHLLKEKDPYLADTIVLCK